MFLLLNHRYLRAGAESFDKAVFDIFDLKCRQLVTVADLSQMLLTLPPSAIISGINGELKLPNENQHLANLLGEDRTDTDGKREGFDYRIIRAPDGYSMIYRNKKLLIRAEE